MMKRVLSVGQCGADHEAIARIFSRHLDALVVPVATVDEAWTQLSQESYDLVLANRVFDADGSLGLDFIRKLKAGEATCAVPVVLVSNYDDAQAEARSLGALPGFGKGALGHPQMLAR